MRSRPEPAPRIDPDLDLLRLASTGDATAFRRLVDRHAESLYRLARSLSHSRTDAEDVMQETLLGAYRGMKSFGGRSLVRTWLVHILMRQSMKAWRRAKRDRRTRSIEAGGAPEPVDPRTHASPTAGEAPAEVATVIRSLAPAHREVLVLKELNGLSAERIAERLGIPRGTVDSRLSRARAELKAQLVRRGWPVGDPHGARGVNLGRRP